VIVHETTDLAPVLAGWSLGLVDAERLQAAFDAATLYVQRVAGVDGRPALAAYGDEDSGERYVAVYSSLTQLARHVLGRSGASIDGADWAGAPGRDLLDLLPDGHGVVVDPAGQHPAVLPAGALRRGTVIARAAR
jgi:hypothetical protein